MWASAARSSRASRSAVGAAPRSHAAGQVAALDVLHHQIGAFAGVEVVDRDQVRVLEAGGDLRLAPEAIEVRGIRGQDIGEHLDRDRAAKALVGRQPDDGHAAVAEAPVEQVALTQALPRGDERRLCDRGPALAAALGIELVGRLVMVQDLC